MEINESQAGLNIAVFANNYKLELAPEPAQSKSSAADTQVAVQQNTKGLPVSAETDKSGAVDVSAEQIKTAVSQLNEFVQTNSRQLDFSVHEGSKKQVVKVTDTDSGKVIRQIPSEEVLALSERLQNLQTEVGTAIGLLFNKQV